MCQLVLGIAIATMLAAKHELYMNSLDVSLFLKGTKKGKK